MLDNTSKSLLKKTLECPRSINLRLRESLICSLLYCHLFVCFLCCFCSSLSGLLNSINGLWTTDSEEQIIIFTTKHKDQIDSALLHPGKMDMHINLSFCTFNGFKILASNYLDVQSHPLFEPIECIN
jgi:hypothetical protein